MGFNKEKCRGGWRKLSCLSDKNRSKKRGTVTRATNGGFWLKRWAYQAVRLNGTVALKCLVQGPLLPVPRGRAGPTGPIPKVPVGAVPYRGLPYRISLVRYGCVTSPFCVVCSTWRSGCWDIPPCLHRRIIGVRFTAQFLSNRTCNFQVKLIPDATWPANAVRMPQLGVSTAPK